MENIFVLIFSVFREYICLIGIAEHEGRKTELSIAIFSLYEIAYFFYCFFFFYLTI